MYFKKSLLKSSCIILLSLLSFIRVNAANFTSTQNGNWDVGATWGNSGNNTIGVGYPGPFDNATVTTGKTVQVKQSQFVFNITVNSGGVLSTSNNKDLLVLGDYVMNGYHTGGNGSTATFFGFGKSISGIGVIALPGGITLNLNISILSSTNLNIASDITLSAGVTVTNNGKITMVAPAIISAAIAGPIWINAANSTLSPGVATNILNNITLNASATGNTVNYYQTPAQNIKIPSSSIYYNLTLSGTGTKSMTGDLTVLGNIDISATTLNMSSFKLTLLGNWKNEGILSGTGTVLFSGTNAQTLTNSFGELFYNMSISKSSGYLTLVNNATVSNVCTMTNGQINANLNTLTIGTSISTLGSISYSSGFLFNGYLNRWVNGTGIALLFPMGIQYGSYYAPITVTFNALAVSGSLSIRFPPVPGTTNNGLPLVDNGVTVYNTFGTGYYSLTPLNGLSSNNYNVQAVGLPFFNFYTSTRILARPNSASNWVANGTHQACVAGVGPAKRANLTMLPVELTLADTANCMTPVTAPFVGSRSVCTNSTQTYSVANTGNTFLWVVQGGTQISGGNTNSITVNWGSTGTTGVLIVTEHGPCGFGLPVFDFITISPTTLTSINGKDYAPENTSVGSEESYYIASQPGYTYAWSVTGGTIITGASTDSITVRWGPAGTGKVTNSITNGCGTSTIVKSVTIYVVINSIQSGSWNSTSTWDCNCIPASYNSVRVRNPHVVTFPNSNLIINNLIADIGGTFNNTTNKTLTVNGDLFIDGTYTGTAELIHNGTGSIDGVGTISTTGNLTMTGGDKTILPTCVLKRSTGDIVIQSGINIFNNGIITASANIIGLTASSSWTNNAGSILNIGGSFLTIGTAVVNTVSNLVEYNGTASQNIKQTDYYDLSSSSTGARVLPGSGIVGVAGDFTPGSNAFTITGSTVNFNGTDQNIGAFTFNNLTISGGGTKTLTGSVTYNAVLNLTSGIIATGSNTLTAPSTASVSRTSGHVNGNYQKWISSTSAKTFEVGTATDYTPITATFASVTTAGYITASVTSGDHPSIASTCLDPNKSVNEYYTLTNNSLTAGTFTLAFNYLASNVDVGSTLSKFGVEVYNGSTWSTPLTLVGVPSSTQTTVSGVTTFGSYEIAETCLYTWTGTTSTAWNIGTNWNTSNVPASTNDVLIPSSVVSGNMPVVSASSISKSLTNNGTITFGGSGILNMYGNVSNTGIITTVSGSTLAFAGSSAQTITGVPILYNVTVNNTIGGVSLLSAVTVKGALTLSSGVLTTGSNLTINFDNGGNIAYNVSDAGSISGNVTGTRNIIAHTHYIAAPFSGVTAAQVQATTPLFVNPYWKMYSKNFTAQNWAAVTDVTTAMPLGTGFSLSLPSTAPLTFTGTYNHAFTLTGATYSNAVSGKYILVGNPYPSTLDWSVIYNGGSGSTSNVSGSIYYWAPSTNQVSSWVGGVGSGSPAGTQYVPAMQSFMVSTTGSGGNSSISINNSARTSLQNPSFLRVASDEILRIKLQTPDTTKWDDAVVRFNDLATTRFDSDFDSHKILNQGAAPSIYTTMGTDMYSINSVANPDSLPIIPVAIKLPANATYTLSVANSDPRIEYILVDKKLGTENSLSGSTYVFSGSTTDDVNRFQLQLRTSQTTGTQTANAAAGLQISSSTKGFVIQTTQFGGQQADIEIVDITGKTIKVLSGKNLSNGVTYIPLDISDGAYIVKILVEATVFSQLISLVK